MDQEQEELLKEKLEPHRQDADANHFLNLISQMESSSGQNTDHPINSGGIQNGEQAIGQYALMPNTIREMANRSQDPNMKQLIDMDQNQLNDKMQNKDLEYNIARQLADKVLNEQGNDDMAAYAWNKGHNLTPQQVIEHNYQNEPYVQKFDLLKQKLKGNK